ncbi:MAG: AMP-binding protein [Desulfobacterales bacterium]|nr:MAG: AMP-binding protein [Desulfobacterales bacterium]
MPLIHHTIGGLLHQVTQKYAPREALVHTEIGVRYDYGRLSREVARVARGFLQIGLQRGDKVAIWAPNIPEWIFALCGLAKIGALTVPIDPAATPDSLRFILTQSECRGLIVAGGIDHAPFLKMALAAKHEIPSLDQILVIGGASDGPAMPWTALLTRGDQVAEHRLTTIENAVRPEDPVAIMYTSGTTGVPKGVVMDHLGLINKSMCATERQGITAEDRLCLFFPLFHMFGNTCIALAGLLRGAALVMPGRSFNPALILQAIHQENCTAVYGSPSMLIALVDHPDFDKQQWKTVTKGIIGGAPCPMELMRRIVEDIGVTGITVAYGITEASSWITMTHPDDPIALRVATIGTPLACNEVQIVEPGTGERLPPNRPGELCTRGFLMQEYYRMPAATATAIDQDQWFHTGDLGEMDAQGYVKITGRLKDVIVRKGVDIYPVEIEEIIYQLPEVSEAQVFGFLHSAHGEEVAAWIKLKEGSRLSLERLAAHVQKNIAAGKVPHYYKIVAEFPMTGSGKVQKFKMAELARKEYASPAAATQPGKQPESFQSPNPGQSDHPR